MGFFKTKKDVVEFSRAFYDKYLFGPAPLGGDFNLAYAESIHRTISEKDSRFASVVIPKLIDELLGLRLEMTGTAWTHKSNYTAAIANSVFTKKYLAEKGRLDLWEGMREYNALVAVSLDYDADLESRFTRGKLAAAKAFKSDLFHKWIAEGHDAEAAQRVLHRMFTDNRLKDGRTASLLGDALMRRVGSDYSQTISQQLAFVSFGFYQGASEALDGVKLLAA